ncbi:MAG TPA: hypothetical protein VI077_07560 [Pseudolabrys sp.]
MPAKGAEKLSLLAETDQPYISTGHLPASELLNKLVAEACAKYKSNTEGENSQVYPALARVPATLFGICVVGTNGAVQWGERRPKSRAIFAVRPYSRMHTKVV